MAEQGLRPASAFRGSTAFICCYRTLIAVANNLSLILPRPGSGFIGQLLPPLFFLFLLFGQISLAFFVLVIGLGQETS